MNVIKSLLFTVKCRFKYGIPIKLVRGAGICSANHHPGESGAWVKHEVEMCTSYLNDFPYYRATLMHELGHCIDKGARARHAADHDATDALGLIKHETAAWVWAFSELKKQGIIISACTFHKCMNAYNTYFSSDEMFSEVEKEMFKLVGVNRNVK